MTDFTGKVIAVTGGARGIGGQIAADFAACGATVAIADLDVSAATGDHRLAQSCDVTDSDQVNGFIDATVGELGSLDVLVNAAGTVSRGLTEDLTDRDWDRVIGVNLTGVFKTTRAALAQMRTQDGGGSIINIASQAGVRAETYLSHYAASKAAVLHFTRVVALEYAPHIRVNAVCPGLVETDLVRDALEGYARETGITYDQARSERLSAIPMGRFQSAADIAAAVLFLSSPAAGEITGHIMDVSGGEMIPR